MFEQLTILQPNGCNFGFHGRVLHDQRWANGFDRSHGCMTIYEATDPETGAKAFVFHHFDSARGINAYEEYDTLAEGSRFFGDDINAAKVSDFLASIRVQLS